MRACCRVGGNDDSVCQKAACLWATWLQLFVCAAVYACKYMCMWLYFTCMLLNKCANEFVLWLCTVMLPYELLWGRQENQLYNNNNNNLCMFYSCLWNTVHSYSYISLGGVSLHYTLLVRPHFASILSMTPVCICLSQHLLKVHNMCPLIWILQQN